MTIGGYLILGCLYNPSLNHTTYLLTTLRIQNNSDSKVKKKKSKKK